MSFLETVYKELDFISGSFHSASESPQTCHNHLDWIDKGEWLALAQKVGADKIFFVGNNPVVVFTKCENDSVTAKIKAFNRTWCMARPRLLFLATPGELTVYDLAQPPVKQVKEWKKLKKLAVLHNIGKVSEVLAEFHRDNIESGRLFGDKRFGDINNRADKSLIRDLRVVRQELIDSGLGGENLRYAHALIGRSIFIRYLEDRRILTKDYFFDLANGKVDWIEMLNSPVERSGIDFSERGCSNNCVSLI